MRLRLLRGRVLVLATALALGVTACGSDDSGEGTGQGAQSPTTQQERTPALEALITAASEEGELNLNWGFSQPDAGPLVEAFNAEYPDIKVTITPEQNQPANLAKLLQEAKAGRRSSTDAFLAVPELIWQAGPKRADALENVEWAEFDPRMADLVEADGTMVTLFDQIPGFTYNTNEIDESELPQSAADVLEMEQPIASTPYAAQFNVLATEQALGREPAIEYLKALDPAGLIGCGDLSRIASGEFAALWIGCGTNISKIFKAQGAPVETHVIKDAGITYPWYMGVPKNSEHPNAAKLWIAWLTTRNAQDLLYEREFADNKRIEGSRTAQEIADYESEGVEFIVPDYKFVQANPELFDREFAGQLIGALTK